MDRRDDDWGRRHGLPHVMQEGGTGSASRSNSGAKRRARRFAYARGNTGADASARRHSYARDTFCDADPGSDSGSHACSHTGARGQQCESRLRILGQAQGRLQRHAENHH